VKTPKQGVVVLIFYRIQM